MSSLSASSAAGDKAAAASAAASSAAAGGVFLTDGCAEGTEGSEQLASSAGAERRRMASGDADWRQWRAATAAESVGKMQQMRRQKLAAERRLEELQRTSSELLSYSSGRFADAAGSGGGGCRSRPAADGQQRARLMNELRLHQPPRPVRFRHDRTAQELVQEGCLPSRRLLAAYPWPDAYRYTPAPRPKLTAWACAQVQRAAERSRWLLAAEEEEEEEDDEEAVAEQQQQQQQQTEIELAAAAGSLPQLEEPKQPTSRKASAKRGTKQRSKSQSSLKRQEPRPFSVSSLGEEQLAQAHEETQLLAEVFQRIRDREAARRRKAEAEAAAAAAELQRQQEQQQQELQEQQQQQQQQQQEAAAAEAHAEADKKQKRKKSPSSSKGSAGSGGRKKQPAASPPRKASPKQRAKSPKARAKSPKPRAKSPKAKKEEPPPPQPPPPPSTPPPPEEPPPKDAVDLLLDEIQGAVVMFKAPEGELPAFPCPSSEEKSRQHLTRLWWRGHSSRAAARPSSIT